MASKHFKKNGIYDLPVKKLTKEKNQWCYVVEADDREYSLKLFSFQMKDPVPETISCLVKDIDEHGLVLVQSHASLLSRLYMEGKIYSFCVRRSLSDISVGCYELGDGNGFSFRVVVGNKVRLQERQRISCMVTKLQDGKIYLKYIPEEFRNTNEVRLVLDEILGAVGVSDAVMRWIRGKILRTSFFFGIRDAFVHGNEEWPLMVIELLDKQIEDWVKPGSRRNGLLLDLYHKVCLYLLEDSDLLKRCAAEKRIEYRLLLSQAARHAEKYREAVRLVALESHTDYIDDLFGKLWKSGCLYNSESRLDVLVCIFYLKPELMESRVQTLFEIILKERSGCCVAEPYHSIFISLLEIYIDKSRADFDLLGKVECEEEEIALKRLITALAILLLLSEEDTLPGWKLRRSMLYRYLTFMKGSVVAVLLEKSLCALLNTKQPKLEFGWKDVSEPMLLVIRTSYPFPGEEENGKTHVSGYTGLGACLCVRDGSLLLMPSGVKRNMHSCLPEWMLPWHRLQVLLPDAVNCSIAHDTKDLAAYLKLWKEVEYALFCDAEQEVAGLKKRKVKPDVGDEVTIRVLKSHAGMPDCFLCRIEDDAFQGEGMLSIKDIVHYNPVADISAFCSDTGKPYLLQAEVMGVDEQNVFKFGMSRLLEKFIYQGVYVGEMVQCLVTESQGRAYWCICSYGYSVCVGKESGMPDLKPGAYIEAEVCEVNANGMVKADFVRQIIETFHTEDAFTNLLFNYADECVFEEEIEEEDELPETELPKEYAYEMMYLVERNALFAEDYIGTYNYIGFARLLAILFGKEDMARYYSERMYLLQMLQQFAINGQMDMEKLRGRKEACGDMLAYPQLQAGLLELLVLGSLGYSAQDIFLWKMIQQSKGERLQRLSRLVLSYNLLGEASMGEQREAIRCEINEVLNMDVGKHTYYSFGSEDQYTEFKSSLVYPADNKMRPDLHKQTLEIMSVICGFLNAEGGTLYLGVNDSGIACGLKSDIEYFNGSQDKFDLHVRNSIVRYMGTEANAQVSVSYPDTAGKLVYAMKIRPCPHVVTCKGTCYQRQGTSTWPLLGEALDAFKEVRKPEPEKTDIVPEDEVSMAVPESVPSVEETAGTVQESFELPAAKPVEENTVTTSLIRPNATHSWMEGYGVGTICYLHFLSYNSYLMTDDECWRNDILLSLAIHESEADGYLVIVFESGRILRVAVGDLLDKKLNKEYKRYAQEKVVFASPARKDDALLTVMSDAPDRSSYRLDDVRNLKEGNMLAKGDFISVAVVAKVIQCDIVPADKKRLFKRIYNQKFTSVGPNLNVYWGKDELLELEGMGIKIQSLKE